MTLIDQIKPLIAATQVPVSRIEADPETGDVILEGGVTISPEERAKAGLFGPHATTVYVVTYTVGIPQTQWEPADVDVVDVGEYPSLTEAVEAALGVVIEHRLAAYQDSLADEEMARAYAAIEERSEADSAAEQYNESDHDLDDMK